MAPLAPYATCELTTLDKALRHQAARLKSAPSCGNARLTEACRSVTKVDLAGVAITLSPVAFGFKSNCFMVRVRVPATIAKYPGLVEEIAEKYFAQLRSYLR